MDARHRRPGRAFIVLLAALTGLVAASCSTSASLPTTTSPAPPPASALLNAADLGPGWQPAGAGGPVALPCSAPRAAGSVVGAHGASVVLVRSGGPAAVVEYAGSSASPVRSYVSAIDQLQTTASCDRTVGARTSGSTFDGVISLPPLGVRNVGMLFTDSVDGVTTQSGYDIVRAGQTIVVVGSTGNARLDSAALGRVTALAVDKLGRR